MIVTTHALVEICREVFADLGVGHCERVYHKGIISILNQREIFHRSEVVTPIYFHGDVVGTGRADLVVGRYAIELKAVERPPSKVSGQLLKYVKSLNKDRVDAFNAMCVESYFFPTGGKSIVDTEYDRQTNLLREEMYSGLIINFNQKTATLDFMKLQDPSLQPVAEVTSNDLENHVATFCRCCIESTENEEDVIPFYQMVKEYETFTGLTIVSIPDFKRALSAHVRTRRQNAKGTAGRMSSSDYKNACRVVYCARSGGGGIRLAAC